ncbi:MAG: hypothetical protein RMK51_08675 [Meiothermus sp.]|uniref:hypothetical protein n=1 Tax=Meiothermus sp. TaxID=1955249 RepID=UPI0025E1EC29|nr:hypothetical protein [Meiothermus sp.]MCS7069428.1 hypothetical protein [Meiothermus sp.]MDW8425995.1 hypothetical protein [Meiothermus sp.]
MPEVLQPVMPYPSDCFSTFERIAPWQDRKEYGHTASSLAALAHLRAKNRFMPGHGPRVKNGAKPICLKPRNSCETRPSNDHPLLHSAS